MPVRLLVVDDHTLFRRGLIALLGQSPEVAVVAEAADAGEALRSATTHQPDVILLDNHLPGVHGIDALPQLLQASPQSRVLMLTVSEDANDLAQALSRGAAGYLLKTAEGAELIQSIVRVHQGESVVSTEMTTKLVLAYQQAIQGADNNASSISPPPAAPVAPPEVPVSPLQKLSPRERDILREIARGASNKEIARTLDIAETTVKIHVQHILRKLNLSSRVQAAVMASSDLDQP
ncbi:response regulator [Aquabacterium sp. A3]|uniref:response regulator n=1 Tax=Aquabacterium sp. A3 TaxID=3132829 RepID=UPI003119C213